MKVYNENKTQILTEYDLEKGYLKADTIENFIPAVEAVEEVSHYEIVKEYPNGGKDVKKVIDIQGVKGVEEYYETENIQVYIPYTENEIAKINAQKRIAELKKLLAETDYQAIKYAEGWLMEEEYAPIKAQRQAYREEINRLEMLL
jgi:hypothetical protein